MQPLYHDEPRPRTVTVPWTRREDVPVSPVPTTMVFKRDPGTEAHGTLEDLLSILLAYRLLANSAVVGRDL